MTGRFCEKHQRYCADGVCPYCEPEAITPVVGVRPGMQYVGELEPGKTLLEALTRPNPLLVDKPWERARWVNQDGPPIEIQPLSHTPEVRLVPGPGIAPSRSVVEAPTLLDVARGAAPPDLSHILKDAPYQGPAPLGPEDWRLAGAHPTVRKLVESGRGVFCACGELMYERGHAPFSPWPYHSLSGVHTPTRCSLKATYMGMPVVVDASLKPEDIGFEPPGAKAMRDTIELEKWERVAKARAQLPTPEDKDTFEPWPRTVCACGSHPLTSGEIHAGIALQVGKTAHGYDRCVTER